MRNPEKRLFMFRVMRTGECGLIRAHTVEEAGTLAMECYNFEEGIEVKSCPRNFKLHIPNFGRGR